jgi:glutamine amidotransferase
VLERSAGGPDGARPLDHSSGRRRIKAHSADLATSPAVVIASEPMDDDPGWRLLGSGELLHVDGGLNVSSRLVLDAPPAHLLTLADLDPRARSSQQPQTYAQT